MCLIISFTGIQDINTRTFLFYSDDNIYILETIKTLNETNKCFYHRGPLRSFGEQENEGIYFSFLASTLTCKGSYISCMNKSPNPLPLTSP